MKRGLIITEGTLDLEFAGQYLKDHSFDCVVSVDGGLKYTKELDVMPHAIVGDFDTIHKEILDEYRQIPSILWEFSSAFPPNTADPATITLAPASAISRTFFKFTPGGGNCADRKRWSKIPAPGRDGWSLRAKHFFWYAGAFFYQKLY